MALDQFDGMTDKQLIEHVWGTVPQHPIAVSVAALEGLEGEGSPTELSARQAPPHGLSSTDNSSDSLP
jgi:hypothetical protein